MKKRDYLIISFLVLVILGCIYYVKGFFPFGKNYIIWGDMHSQVVPLYYKFYDAIYHSQSLMIDFSSGGGISLLGIFAYYISSPFTLLVLLFPRDMIVYAPSIIIAIKILLCAITALYFLKKIFKNIPSTVQILLAFLYAFSIYNLAHYIITGWIDIVYLFPLLLVGLKELIDHNKKKLYFIILTLSFLMNFYLTFMILLFTILGVFVYLKIYQIDKSKQKKIISQLGFCTLLSLLCSSTILIPTFLQMGSSVRTGFNLNQILHSRLGPIVDKMSYLFLSGLGIVSALLLMWKKRKEKIALIIFITLFLLGLPILIEPINRMWHFGSYVFYPYRFGFILTFIFTIISALYWDQLKTTEISKTRKMIMLGITFVFSVIYIFFVSRYYHSIQNCITHLTFTKEKIGFFIMFFLCVLSVIVIGTLLILGKKNKINILSLWIVSIVMVLCNGFLYFGIDHEQEELQSAYEIMNQLHQDIVSKEVRIKSEVPSITWNFGMVVGNPTLDHFTSLTGNRAFTINQKLGYDSYWMDTLSNGSNLFIDTMLGHQYLLTDKKNDFYTLLKQYDSLFLEKTPLNIIPGFFINDMVHIDDLKNSFDTTNQISKSLFGETVFDVYKLDSKETIQKIVPIDNEKAVYVEAMNSYDNAKKTKIYHAFRIYVNDELIVEEYPNRNNVNAIYLGTFDQDIKVTIEKIKDVDIRYMALGTLDISKMIDCFRTNLDHIMVDYQKNKISVSARNLENHKYLFLPVNYLDGMKAKNNGNKVSIVPIMDNYVGIPLVKGNNEIMIHYEPSGLKIGLLLTIFGCIMTILYFKFQNKIMVSWIQNIGYIVFQILACFVVFILYVMPMCAFLFYLIF